MTIRTPEQIAQQITDEYAIALPCKDAELWPMLTAAIEADRAQRPHIPTESEWHESERKRLGWTPEEWAENTLPEDWRNPRPVVVMWGDTLETPSARLDRFHEEIIALIREREEDRAELLTLIDALREKVAR